MFCKHLSLLCVNMLKRAAEEAPAEEKAPKKGGGTGARAEEVTNPIPRLFSQNSITIHVSQRTFEEISPAELKWFPSSQYWACMFDKFHYTQFSQYFKRCSTFEVHHPKVRLSNLLMLQDALTTQSGTPVDNSIYTQACYLMHYEPKGIKNWFKLGTTSDCGKTQKILSYAPMKPSDCTKVSQLITIGENNYADFERLVINPAKPDLYAGFTHNVLRLTKTEPSEKIDISELTDLTTLEQEKLVDGYVVNNYISPQNSILGQFSCSAQGMDKYLPLMSHTTFARNLDKVSLHKYGDTIEWDVQTNMDGIKLLNHKYNHPFGDTDVQLKGHDDAINICDYVFCYPSDNRPFFSRKDNLNSLGAAENPKEFAPLKHHFITMPPIKKSDGSLIKQRCSFICEQSVSFTFHFPETIVEGDAKYVDNQKNGVLLRPMITKTYASSKQKTPTPEPDPDEERNKELQQKREEIVKKFSKDLRKEDDAWVDGTTQTSFHEYVVTVQKYWQDINSIINICTEIPQLCTKILDLIRGLNPSRNDDDEEAKHKLVSKPFTQEELDEMIRFSFKNRQRNFFGYLITNFMFYILTNNLKTSASNPDAEVTDVELIGKDNEEKVTIIAEKFAPLIKDYVAAEYKFQCPLNKSVRLWPGDIRDIKIWNRDFRNAEYDGWDTEHLHRVWSGAKRVGPWDIDIGRFIAYCKRMGLYFAPDAETYHNYLKQYNTCVENAACKIYPPIKKDFAKPQQAFDPEVKFFDYKTSLFYV